MVKQIGFVFLLSLFIFLSSVHVSYLINLENEENQNVNSTKEIVNSDREEFLPANNRTTKLTDTSSSTNSKDSSSSDVHSLLTTSTVPTAQPKLVDSDDTPTTTIAGEGAEYYDDYEDEPPFAPENHPQGYCVVDVGVSCGTGGWGNTDIPCARDRSPRKLKDEEALDMIKEICPELVGENETEPLLCCDAEGVFTLAHSYDLPRDVGLGRCPSCMFNFRKSFCQSTCSPYQSKFLRIVDTTQLDDGKKKINSMEYYMKQDYATGLYDSCKGIQGFVPGSYVMDVLCGRWGSQKCNGYRWLQFMGTSADNGGYSPFQINFVLTTEDELTLNGSQKIFPMNEPTIPCELGPPGEMSCSSRDCEQARMILSDPPPLPSKPEKWTIGGHSGTMTFGVILYFVICGSVFIYFVILNLRRKTSLSRK